MTQAGITKVKLANELEDMESNLERLNKEEATLQEQARQLVHDDRISALSCVASAQYSALLMSFIASPCCAAPLLTKSSLRRSLR